jgi:DNA-binding NarL/FixJ family response regulator
MQKSIIIAYFNNLTTQLLCERFESKGCQILNIQDNLLELVETEKPDYLFIGTGGGVDNIAICRQIKSMPHLATKCVVFLPRDYPPILPAIFADISGYLYEDADIEEVETCLLRLSGGERYISPLMFKGLSNPKIADYKAFIAPLGAREKEVFRFIAYGYSNKKIADVSFTSIKTIESHKNNIIKKLGLKNTTELLETAIRMTFGEPNTDLTKGIPLENRNH